MLDLDKLTQDELRYVASEAIWGFDIWSETPEGNSFWYEVAKSLDASTAVSMDRAAELRKQLDDMDAGLVSGTSFSVMLARTAADAIEKADLASFSNVVATLCRRIAEHAKLELPPGTTVASPPITDL